MNIDVFIELVAFQSEGSRNVFDILEQNKVNQITIAPQYFIETGDENDLRLPPLDLTGQSRELERPLFGGERVKYGQKYLCFKPDESLYTKTVYRPKYMLFQNDYCAEVINEARKRKMKVSVFLPNVPDGGYLNEHLPVDVFGKTQKPKISNEACRNSDDVREYYIALAKNLIRVYRPDEIMIDWIEFTDYFFSDNLLCFCSDCRKRMTRYGYSVEKLETAARNVFDWIKTQTEVPSFEGLDWNGIWDVICQDIRQLFEFKKKSVEDFILVCRNEIDDAGWKDVDLLFTGFGLPMNKATGLCQNLLSDYRTIRIQPKSYRFHWGLMVGWYAQELVAINGKTEPDDWVPFVKNLLEVTDPSSKAGDFCMPEPDKIGPIDFSSESAKVRETYADAVMKDKASIRLHGYAPVDIFRRRLECARDCGYENISIQRYGYMCDEKIMMLKEFI